MPQVKLLKIFLASPGDVVRERNYVIEVIDEINRTIAPSKGVRLEVVRSEENVFPGYNPEGGQAVLNAQIANMEKYALFVGIMWNRVGTPTPRADSGTIEEFERAVEALESKGQPQIWFYFRLSPASLNTKGEWEQRGNVLDFKNRIQPRALICDYKNSSNFRDQFRNHITLWLNERQAPLTLERLWQQLVDRATQTDQMKPEIANNLGMWNPAPKVPRGTPFHLVVNLETTGYLILLEKNPEQQIWCLSPSFLAPPSRLEVGEVKLPLAYQDTFTADSVGIEQIVAIISQDRLDLDWLPGDDDKPLEMRKEHLTELLEYLENSSEVQVFCAEYQVTE
ncbi:hypothetical protein [Microcoleus sp. D3_18a_C4]|uniref:hypothetical protein n=1 Tax=Microcoleus sp. D3_18a_C4 TaxID=3055332 RepID=UPI002FD20F7E